MLESPSSSASLQLRWESDPSRMNFIVAVAAQYEQIIGTVGTASGVSGQVVQLKNSCVSRRPFRHVPATLLTGAVVAFVDLALDIRRDVSIMSFRDRKSVV